MQMYDFDAVIVREGGEGARCDSLTKTRNVACQVLGSFQRLGDRGGDEGELCVDTFNAWIQAECRAQFEVVSGEDFVRSGEHRMSIEKRAVVGGEFWWLDEMRELSQSRAREGGGKSERKGERAKKKKKKKKKPQFSPSFR